MKYFGKLNSVRDSDYNLEYSKRLLQIPHMAVGEQLYHYLNRLKARICIEVEKGEPENVREAINITDKMDNMFQGAGIGQPYGSYSGFGFGGQFLWELDTFHNTRGDQ